MTKTRHETVWHMSRMDGGEIQTPIKKQNCENGWSSPLLHVLSHRFPAVPKTHLRLKYMRAYFWRASTAFSVSDTIFLLEFAGVPSSMPVQSHTQKNKNKMAIVVKHGGRNPLYNMTRFWLSIPATGWLSSVVVRETRLPCGCELCRKGYCRLGWRAHLIMSNTHARFGEQKSSRKTFSPRSWRRSTLSMSRLGHNKQMGMQLSTLESTLIEGTSLVVSRN